MTKTRERRIDPTLKSVIDTYQTVKKMTSVFVTNLDAVSRGLMVSGDAGMGKTHYVTKAFEETDTQDNVMHVKGSSVTAAALFCLLYFNREKGQVLVLDDVDVMHKGAAEVSAILDMFKGATEPTKGSRMIGWHRASPNPLMVANNVPQEFDFQGSIVWITNDKVEDIRKKAKGHWNAISSRFTQVEAWFEEHEKIAYTLHLIEEVDILGKNCTVKEGGFPEDVINDTIDYLHDNYTQLQDITPRVAIKIADIRQMFPDEWKMFCDNQFLATV